MHADAMLAFFAYLKDFAPTDACLGSLICKRRFKLVPASAMPKVVSDGVPGSRSRP